MLSPVISLLLGFVASPPSWVEDLNQNVQKQSEAYQEQAKSIVESTIKAPFLHKSCKINSCSPQKFEKIEEKERKNDKEGQSKSENFKEVERSTSAKAPIDKTPDLLVCVSFSMPLHTLKALSAKLHKVGGKLVLRGLLEGSFTKTAQKLKTLQEDVLIDPVLFETYKIQHVPTFVLNNTPSHDPSADHVRQSFEEAKEEALVRQSLGEGGLAKADLLSGHVSLEYALEKFTSAGNSRAKELLKRLREKS